MKFKHIKSKEPKSFSLIIVPNSKNVRQVSFPKWLPKFIILLIILSIVATGYLLNSYLNLKEDYIVTINNLDALKKKNYDQKLEIDNLKQKTAEIEEKLKSISELQETVRNMVGLKQSETVNESSATVSTSRDGGTINRSSVILNTHLNDIEKHMEDLSKLLDQSQEDLSNLIGDVEQRLKYLDAKPTLTPAPGRISSGFGYRKNPFGRNREFHSGIDIANNYNTKIVASGSGIVTFAGYNGGLGKVIVISHGYGYQTIYGHNNKILVKVGDKVKKGDVIALMGSSGRSTGPHVHFEIRYYGKAVNPNTVLDNYD